MTPVDVGRLLSLAQELEEDAEELEKLARYFERDIRFLEVDIYKLDSYTADRTLRGIGQSLHQYYHTIEKAVEKVLKLTGEIPQSSGTYHIEVMRKAVLNVKGLRPAILPRDLLPLLDELRGYRHAFRNLYRSSVKREKLAELVRSVKQEHSRIVSSIRDFASFLRSEAGR